MADLRTNYQDDVLDASKNTARVYDLVDSNGTVVLAGVHLEDKTVYTTEGDDYGATDINTQNGKINELSNDLTAKSLVNTYYDSSVNKLYQVNSDGTKGEEIKVGAHMKVKLYNSPNGTVNLNTAIGGHFASAEDYFVYMVTASAQSHFVANKTATSFDLTGGPSGYQCNMQIVFNEDKFIPAT